MLLDLLDPPPLLEVLGHIIGPELRLCGVQSRTVIPESDGGYTSWHRDTGGPPETWPTPVRAAP